MPRVYREAPVNSIWEGCGNVMCLDILRALAKDPESAAALVAELEGAKGSDKTLDSAIAAVKAEMTGGKVGEADARRVAEQAALALQGSILVREGHGPVAELFIRARLGDAPGHAYSALPRGVETRAVVERTTPQA